MIRGMSRAPRRNRRRVFAGLFLALLAVAVFAQWSCGHVIAGQYALNHGGVDFDVAKPPCAPVPRPACGPDDVCLRYLGAGGLYVAWHDASLLTGPFFSNPSLLRSGLGTLRWDAAAITAGLAGLDGESVAAIVAGHSHFDHIGDLPVVARSFAPRARLLVNASGENVLGAYPELAARVDRIDRSANPATWIAVRDRTGRVVFRVLPIRSQHAPHFDHYTWGKGTVDTPWPAGDDWERHRLADFKDGGTWAFLIDLLDPATGAPRFRIYYQDSASDRDQGWPPQLPPGDERAVDLAVLCVASHQFVRDAPEWLLERVRPAHVLVGHWEDFFRARSEPLRFVPLLSDGKADAYLERVRTTLGSTGQAVHGPLDPVCGPSEAGFTWPMPGDWLRFHSGSR